AAPHAAQLILTVIEITSNIDRRVNAQRLYLNTGFFRTNSERTSGDSSGVCAPPRDFSGSFVPHAKVRHRDALAFPLLKRSSASTALWMAAITPLSFLATANRWFGLEYTPTPGKSTHMRAAT